jgi:hypothetical protein
MAEEGPVGIPAPGRNRQGRLLWRTIRPSMPTGIGYHGHLWGGFLACLARRNRKADFAAAAPVYRLRFCQ